MKFSSTTLLATLCLFTTSISAKHTYGGKSCNTTTETERTCRKPNDFLESSLHDYIVECRYGKWIKIEKCATRHRCFMMPNPECFFGATSPVDYSNANATSGVPVLGRAVAIEWAG